MRIAIGPISAGSYGGTTQHVRNIVRFSKYKFHVIVYPKYSLSHPNYRFILPFALRNPKVRSVVKDPYWFFVENAVYPSFDIVHFHGSPLWPEFSFRKHRRGFKGVHTAHNFYMEQDALSERERKVQQWSNETAIESYRNADTVISVAKWLQKFLLDEFDIRAVHIPNGIDLNEFNKSNPNNFRDKYGIRQGFILFLGRLSKNKRPELFVELAKLMPEKMFLMAGHDVKPEGLKRYLGYEPPKNIRCLGMLPWRDAINALAASEVFVLPSINECMPMTILEAMASKKVVVAAINNGSQELIQDGIDGFLFEPDDLDDMHAKVSKALARPEMGDHGHRKIVENYTWEGIVKQTESVYESLVGS